MPKLRSAMHVDTVFTFADRDVATEYPGIVDGIHAFTLRPSDTAPGVEVTEESRPFVEVVATALGLDALRSSRRVDRRTTASASSGTAATTSLRSSPASSSPTTAIRTPTRCSGRQASRSSQSSAPSSAVAGAAATA
jgi:hypothetical protein